MLQNEKKPPAMEAFLLPAIQQDQPNARSVSAVFFQRRA
jgi:hypothetical protein